MPTNRFAVERIAHALRRAEGDVAVAEVCRELGVTEGTFFRWKCEFGGRWSPGRKDPSA